MDVAETSNIKASTSGLDDNSSGTSTSDTQRPTENSRSGSKTILKSSQENFCFHSRQSEVFSLFFTRSFLRE